MALTKRQKQVLDYIADFIEEHGYSPSYEELAQGLHLASLATVHKHIQGLESRSYLKRGYNQSRSIEISSKYLQERRRARHAAIGTQVPLAGRIAAGKPIEAVENREVLQFSDFAGKGDTFGLQVTGDSMIEDHICSGDYVLVERLQEANPGDIVVALVGGIGDHAQALLSGTGWPDSAATRQCRHGTHLCGSGESADPGPGTGSSAQV